MNPAHWHIEGADGEPIIGETHVPAGDRKSVV